MNAINIITRLQSLSKKGEISLANHGETMVSRFIVAVTVLDSMVAKIASLELARTNVQVESNLGRLESQLDSVVTSHGVLLAEVEMWGKLTPAQRDAYALSDEEWAEVAEGITSLKSEMAVLETQVEELELKIDFTKEEIKAQMDAFNEPIAIAKSEYQLALSVARAHNRAVVDGQVEFKVVLTDAYGKALETLKIHSGTALVEKKIEKEMKKVVVVPVVAEGVNPAMAAAFAKARR